MKSNPVKLSIKVAAVIVIGSWVGLFAYYEVDSYMFYRERQHRKAWVAEQVAILAGDPGHLGTLVGVFDSAAWEPWQRKTARSIICDYARLPDEPTDVGTCESRWGRLSEAISSEDVSFSRDEDSGRWMVSAGQARAED